ncbi:Mth938-like domain-containing protein [uncultured Ilyobacter sp.]|uniref:Mth938-like domain-containing protein n=1 Tax=uncultured Ilyobacter sp. TaxID=544433 RepID=UPI002AA6E74A|nr:Mth938-like domain-containing protein [uncultured Ilyobacter sp.]
MKNCLNNFSPKILNFSWGVMDIEGYGQGKDFKLYPGGARSWNWSETGTEHSPGIQPADVEELIEKGCQIVVLSQGVYSSLKVMDSTIELLEKNNVEYHILDTRKAVELYNKLAGENLRIGGLFHSTC